MKRRFNCRSLMNKSSDNSAILKSRAADRRTEIEISDTGSGMSEDMLSRIFEPLFSTKGFGVGLGLPTVQLAMQQHGGDVEVFSEEGRGSRFVLWLPMPEENEVTA